MMTVFERLNKRLIRLIYNEIVFDKDAYRIFGPDLLLKGRS